MSDLEAHWSDDGLSAVLTDDGGWRARLEVTRWWGDGQREPDMAWTVEWLSREDETPTMLEAPIEVPARTADGPERRAELIERALAAMSAPPAIPAPSGLPAPTPATSQEWADHIDLQITCWDLAYRDLTVAVDERAERGEFMRYRALTDALERAYAVDSSLRVLWRGLSKPTKERLSRETDLRAQDAIAHNVSLVPGYDPADDGSFSGYYQRAANGQPYRHWGDLLLAGAFQSKFFDALSWVRGQLVHAATSAPMDLRQWRAGVEPRFKWRESRDFARGRVDDAGRRAYDEVLAGHDVTGLLSHLTDVFVDARRLLTEALCEEEAKADKGG